MRWVVIGCSVLAVGLLSACLLLVTVLRLTNANIVTALLGRGPVPEAGGATPPAQGPPLFRDNFRDNRSGWNEFQSSAGSAQLTNSRLQLTVVGPDHDIWSTIPPVFDDMRIEVDSGLFEGPAETSYGLIFRHQDDDNFYAFEVDGQGRYRLGKVVAGGYIPLVEPTPSPRVQPGQALNRLHVVAVGPRIVVGVNGVDVNEVTDATFERGHLGVTASLDGPGVGQVVFGNLVVYGP